jgi:hypothetical protein
VKGGAALSLLASTSLGLTIANGERTFNRSPNTYCFEQP